MGFKSSLKEAVPFAAMILVECGEVGMTTLTKAAMNSGMSSFVYIVYYNAAGLLLLFPNFVFQTHRNKGKRPPFTLALLWRFFILGLLGKSLLMFGYIGIDYSSPMLASALGNLTPVFTFLIAIIFRMEKVDIRSASSAAKSLGTVIAVTGALVVTLYKGPAITGNTDTSLSALPNHQQNLLLLSDTDASLVSATPPHQHLLLSKSSNWVLGGLLLALGYFFGASWNIVQTRTVKEYPEQTAVVFYYVLFGTIQCTVISLIAEPTPSAWTMHPGIGMFAILYSAIFGTAIRYSLITWCLNEKGPLYVALFKPLGMVVAMIGGLIFLGDMLYLGSIIGAIVIAIGFYTVMWGRAKEEEEYKAEDEVWGLESSDQTTPLLPSYNK